MCSIPGLIVSICVYSSSNVLCSPLGIVVFCPESPASGQYVRVQRQELSWRSSGNISSANIVSRQTLEIPDIKNECLQNVDLTLTASILDAEEVLVSVHHGSDA